MAVIGSVTGIIDKKCMESPKTSESGQKQKKSFRRSGTDGFPDPVYKQQDQCQRQKNAEERRHDQSVCHIKRNKQSVSRNRQIDDKPDIPPLSG